MAMKTLRDVLKDIERLKQIKAELKNKTYLSQREKQELISEQDLILDTSFFIYSWEEEMGDDL